MTGTLIASVVTGRKGKKRVYTQFWCVAGKFYEVTLLLAMKGGKPVTTAPPGTDCPEVRSIRGLVTADFDFKFMKTMNCPTDPPSLAQDPLALLAWAAKPSYGVPPGHSKRKPQPSITPPESDDRWHGER